jgi:hypothetical protein
MSSFLRHCHDHLAISFIAITLILFVFAISLLNPVNALCLMVLMLFLVIFFHVLLDVADILALPILVKSFVLMFVARHVFPSTS